MVDKKNIINFLLRFQNRNVSLYKKIISLLCGAVFFLFGFPVFFLWIASLMQLPDLTELNRLIELGIGFVSIVFGVFWLSWAAISQWKIGKGTPVPNAPTRQLIITGPYKLCRNPIELGAILYYLGLGTLCVNLTIGVVCFWMGFVIGSVYHKFIEEDELEKRFGEDYICYKQATPFLFPKLMKLNDNLHRKSIDNVKTKTL